jgi:predicted RNA-binding Zn-ribbon protein involved in translation (DUF1610 family)
MGIIAGEICTNADDKIKSIAVGFSCQICGDVQIVHDVAMINMNGHLAICDQCKNDLKEIIMQKRNKK